MVDQTGQEVLFQQIVAHHDCCFKLYVFFSMGKLTLRTSLATTAIFASDTNPWYTSLDMISRKELSPEQVVSITGQDLLPERLVKLLVEENARLGGLHCYGLDLIVEEGSGDIYVIDLNDMPSYLGVHGMHDALCRLESPSSNC